MSLLQHAALLLFWAFFGLFHSLLAARAVKQKAAILMGRYFYWYRPLYSLMALVQTVLLLVYQFSIPSRQLWELASPLKPVMVLCALAALTVMGVSIRKYFFRLSGIQALYKKQGPAVLEKSGLHEYMRHPLYAGTLLLAWSLVMLFPLLSHLLACLMMTIYTLIGIRLEEKKLEALYGAQYTSYKHQVPMIIPFTKFDKLSKAVPDKLS